MVSKKEAEELVDENIISDSDTGTGIEVEDVETAERITEPFDPTLIRVATRPMTVDLLCARIKHDELDLAPGFQRKGGIWKDDAQSRLIESMLIRMMPSRIL